MNAKEIEEKYTRFSGLVHFLDPVKDPEETPIELNLTHYQATFDFLDQNPVITVENLSNLFETAPESIRIFELILQLSNFTSAQQTYLMFNLELVNSSKIDESVGYILGELERDKELREQARKDGILISDSVPKVEQLDSNEKYSLLAELKRLIAKQSKKKGTRLLQERLRISKDTRKRVAEYLIEKRSLNDILSGIKPRLFIEQRRIPHDTKSAHGKYAASMLENILKDFRFKCNDDEGPCSNKMIQRFGIIQESLSDDENPFSYCKEKEVESINHPGSPISSESVSRGVQVAKRFDFVLLYRNQPKVVIETNFYTTSGSKIGINEKEYLSLHEKIARTNEKLRFIWVTDGSYWLTKTGLKSFAKLAPSFQDDLKNLAILAQDMKQIKVDMET